MRKLAIILFSTFIFYGCPRHVNVKSPVNAVSGEWRGPFIAADHSYGWYENGRGEWIVVSKSGPHQQDFCPKGVVCFTTDLGEMYSIKRGN